MGLAEDFSVTVAGGCVWLLGLGGLMCEDVVLCIERFLKWKGEKVVLGVAIFEVYGMNEDCVMLCCEVRFMVVFELCGEDWEECAFIVENSLVDAFLWCFVEV